MTKDPQPAFRALADPTRREILAILVSNDMTIGQVAENFDMTRAAVKKHLSILSDAGLVDVHAKGRTRVNSLSIDGLQPIVDWFSLFERFWDDRLDALKTAIERNDQ